MSPRKTFDLKTFDLKSVGKVFDDTLAAIEAEIPTNRALKPEAIEWLKAARYKVMRDVEQAHTIAFPAELAAPPENRGAEDTPPAQLHIDDEFSRLAEGGKCVGAFTASNFGQLVVDGRGDNGGSNSGAKKKRRRTSRTPKDESHEDDDDERRRLRSVTRATSAATLRSSSEASRRSSRKKVKQEDMISVL
ncbi:hypothetical protein C8R47DRAFT_1221650 [Mycena vitilis]|nr:hypothetical protein C8R47DRAFT_1221650 [Mycena vitilis]